MDDTRPHDARDPARLSADVQRAVAAGSPDAVVATDEQGRITDWNASAERLFGWSADEAGGRSMDELIVPERHRATHASAVRRILDQDQRVMARSKLIEMVAMDRDGREIPVQIAASAVRVEGRTSFVSFIRNMSEHRDLEAQWRQQALSDPLTGVANRALFIDRLDRAVSRRKRQPASLALLFVDLDRFKVVNDALGHASGDQVLIAVASRIRTALRTTDSVGRYGGDEFVVLCEGGVAPHQAIALAKRITEAISQPILFPGRSVVVTASIGIATLGETGGEAEELLRDADAAMYQAKQHGGDRCMLVEAGAVMPRRGLARLDIETDLRAAIGRSELRLVYQPTIDLRTGRATGAEALIRWVHPERGELAPLDFIPLAEETGLIVPIGAWVLGEACRQLKAWHDSLGPVAPSSLSVNLSGCQLADGQVAELVMDLLSEHRLAPSSLCLEITESVLMADATGTLYGLAELRELGVRLSIDDFGTGYSSLLYLRRFPVNELKIDRLFVAGLGRNPEDTAIVEGVIALAHALQLTVVAEGVETAEHVALLGAMGSDAGQGYYWSRPISASNLGDLLRVSVGMPGRAVRDDGRAVSVPEHERAVLTTTVVGSAPYRVLLVDDVRAERELLGILLEESARFVVAGEAADGVRGVEMARAVQPDLVVLDISMPGMNGVDALTKIVAASPVSRVVVVSGFVSAGLAQATLNQGASACLDKNVGPERLIEQLLSVLGVDMAST